MSRSRRSVRYDMNRPRDSQEQRRLDHVERALKQYKRQGCIINTILAVFGGLWFLVLLSVLL